VLALAGRPGPEGAVGLQELGRLHTPESTACLLDALTRGDAVHRAKAAGSLGRSRDRAQQRRLLEVAARDPDAEVRARAAAGAGLLAEAPTAPEDVAGLIATLRSATSQTARVDAIDALVASGDRRVLSPLVDAAWDDDPAVARRAARALSVDLSADLRLTARVLERTRRPGWGSRADVLLAAELVSSTRALDAVPLLAQWLGDRDPAVRVVAVRGLDAVGPPDLETHLLRALSDPEPAVRGAASVALRSGALRTCDEPVRDFTDAPILALLADPSPYLRAETAHDVASRGIDPPTNGWSRVEVALVGLLRDRDPFVVLSAADALVTLGVRGAAPAMRKAARAAPRGVRREVRAYLERTAAALEAAPDPPASPR
jgi:HEAT repeat protein